MDSKVVLGALVLGGLVVVIVLATRTPTPTRVQSVQVQSDAQAVSSAITAGLQAVESLAGDYTRLHASAAQQVPAGESMTKTLADANA